MEVKYLNPGWHMYKIETVSGFYLVEINHLKCLREVQAFERVLSFT